MKEIRAFTDEVAEKFKPEKIILFGSYAYGKPTEDSDVDILVVMPHRPNAHVDKAVPLRLAVAHRFPMDLLVRSSKILKKRIALNDYFLKEIVENGKVLYDSADHAMGRERRGRFAQRKSTSSR